MAQHVLSRPRRTALAAASIATALVATAAVGADASAQDIFPKYFFDCGSSRGATFNVGLYHHEPGEARVVTRDGDDYNFVVPHGRFQGIPINGGRGTAGHVILAFDLTSGPPPRIDTRTGVTCNAQP